MLHRAYSTLQIEKSMDDNGDYVIITGIASTPKPDSYRDIVEPMGAKFMTPMPLLMQHVHSQPVGEMTFAKPTKKSIPFEARLPIIKEAGRLKERVDEAIHSLKYSLIKAVSIGFRPVEDAYEWMDNGGVHFKEWEWLELSLVTIPANSDAVISAVKSIDQGFRPASGRIVSLDKSMPGVSGGTTEKRGSVKIIPRKKS